MYCPSCGTQIKTALNFCSRCGGKIEKSNSGEISSKYQNVSGVVGAVGLGGMIALVVLSLKFLKEGVDIGAIGVIIGMFLITILAMIYMIIRMMPRYLENSGPKTVSQPDYTARGSLRVAKTAQLEEPKQTPASVIEDTTRTLDEILVKNK